ncbi:hypothetical protein BHM03_00056249, partial [Ensete ventricosum]
DYSWINICRWTFALVIIYFAQEADDEGAGLWVYSMQLVYQIMGCMHTLNAVFLLVDTFLNNLLYLRDFPVDSACLWFYLVALPLSGA